MGIKAGRGGLPCSRDDLAGRSTYRGLRPRCPRHPCAGNWGTTPDRSPANHFDNDTARLGDPRPAAPLRLSPTNCSTIRGVLLGAARRDSLDERDRPKMRVRERFLLSPKWRSGAYPRAALGGCRADGHADAPRPASLRGALPCRLGRASLSDRPANALPARGCCAAGRRQHRNEVRSPLRHAPPRSD